MTRDRRDPDDEPDVRELLEQRARVRPEDLEPLRDFVSKLPERRRGRQGRGVLAAAAGIVVLLGLGALVATRIPFGTSGAAPGAPDPAAFAGDPRLKVCNATADQAGAIFELAHVRDYQLQLPAAYELKGLQADPEAPALVIVFKGPATPQVANETPVPGTHDLCIVVGADAASWQPVAVVGVDTTGLLAYVPEPTGTPLPANVASWVNRCGGQQAGILAVLRVVEGWDFAKTIDRLDPVPAELVPMPAAEVVVYDSTHPFPPLATPPPGASSPEPRNPLAPGHHDICVLVGRDPATAQRFIHEDVAVTLPGEPTPAPATESPSASSAPIPSSSASVLPAQVDPAQCAAMSFAPDRCLAVVEAARRQASLAWTDIVGVTIAKAPSDASLGSYPVAAVTFRVRDGSSVDQTVRCLGLGGQYSLVCSDRPVVQVVTPIAGYHDVPCGATPGGEPGSACASPMPAIDPAAAAKAVRLVITSRDIPITASGHLEIDMGSATLPNGILTNATFSLADPFTRSITVADGIAMVVRSKDPTRPPFDNIYAHGWYPGAEQVEVFLVLDVTSFQPGALLQVRDLVVR